MRFTATASILAALPLLSAGAPAYDTQFYNFKVSVHPGQPHQNLNDQILIPVQNLAGFGTGGLLNSNTPSTVAAFSFSAIEFHDIANLNHPKKDSKTTSQMILEHPVDAEVGWSNVDINFRSHSGPDNAVRGGFTLDKNNNLINTDKKFTGWLVCQWNVGGFELFWRNNKDVTVPKTCAVVDLVAFKTNP